MNAPHRHSLEREQRVDSWWQSEIRARTCFKEPNYTATILYTNTFTLKGSFIYVFHEKQQECLLWWLLKVLKCVYSGIMGISSVWKESRCASLDCAAGRLSPALLQFQSLCCQPSPECGAVPSASGTPLKPGRHIYSGLWVRKRSRPSSHPPRAACQTTASQDGSSQHPTSRPAPLTSLFYRQK